jgi:putative ABC transport system permease protein
VTRLRQLIVVAELGVSLVLLIGAGLLARSFLKLASTDLGFPPHNLLTLRVNLVGPENGGGPAASLYATAESQSRFYDGVLERIKRLPMVLDAAVSTDVPLSAEGFYQEGDFAVAGRTPVARGQRPHADFSVVSPDFFRTLRIPLLRGRAFDSQDTQRSSDKIVVNEVLARKIFAGENPLGQRIQVGANDVQGLTVVGVVGNIRGSELGAEPEPLIYRCTCQNRTPFLARMAFIVRTARDPETATRALEGQVYAVDRNQPVFDVRTMEERLARSLAPQRFHLLLVGAFAGIAVVLAALGVYEVMSYVVARRTREIGIRIAMGARPRQVERLVLGESVALAVVAALAGLLGAWGLTRYLTSMLYGVTALDTATFAAMPVVLIVIAATAAFIPARRASRVDPMTALREE